METRDFFLYLTDYSPDGTGVRGIGDAASCSIGEVITSRLKTINEGNQIVAMLALLATKHLDVIEDIHVPLPDRKSVV